MVRRYQARRTRAASLAPALDERKVLTDHRVQALLSPSGELPTLPSQQPDRGNSTTNILRCVHTPRALCSILAALPHRTRRNWL